MGRNVFVSYKYDDTDVLQLKDIDWRLTRVRDYVNILEEKFDEYEHYWRGEHAHASLEGVPEDEIKELLKDAIYPTTVTVIFISRGMKSSAPERDQWVPWEIRYSLSEIGRNGKNSGTNRLLAIVLPDAQGSTSYFFEKDTCGVRILTFEYTFQIIEDNFFNAIDMTKRACSTGAHSGHKSSADSYIVWMTWESIEDFNKIPGLIEKAASRAEEKELFDICKTIKN